MQLLFVKNGLTSFQNCLLEEMPFSVLLLRYFISDFLQTELHLCFIFFIFTKFSTEGFFRHLFRSRDLSRIAFLSYFVINRSSYSYLFYRSMFISNCFEKINHIKNHVMASIVLKLTFIHFKMKFMKKFILVEMFVISIKNIF